MDFSDIRKGKCELTLPKLAFRVFAVADIAVIVWAFFQDLDLGFTALLIGVCLFFVAFFLSGMIESYCDEGLPVIEGENEVFVHPDSGTAVSISCNRYVLSNMPFFVFVDGVCYAMLFRGTTVSVVLPDSEVTVQISRNSNTTEDAHPFKGMPTDLKIVTTQIDDNYATCIISGEETDRSETEYRTMIGDDISFEAGEMMSAIIITALMSLKWWFPLRSWKWFRF